MSTSVDFQLALHQAKQAAIDLDVARLFRDIDPESYNRKVVVAGAAFDNLIEAVRLERERLLG